MLARIFAGVLVLLCTGCAGQTIVSRTVSGEANWFVRLDTFLETRATADLRFDHPAEFSEAALAAILSRVQVQERVGLLERKPFPQFLFSSGEIKQLAPGLQKALRTAKPTEWAVFYSALPAGGGQEVTSGGLFVKDNMLHVVVANHHDRVPSDSGSLAAIRTNPLSPLSGKGLALSFDPQKFISGVQTTWLGGAGGAPASELILNQSAFLAEVSAPAVAPGAASTLPPPLVVSGPQSAAAPQDAPRNVSSYTLMKEQVAGMQTEIERLQRRLEEQDDDIAMLKTRLFELDSILKNQPPKKPAR